MRLSCTATRFVITLTQATCRICYEANRRHMTMPRAPTHHNKLAASMPTTLTVAAHFYLYYCRGRPSEFEPKIC